MTVSKIRLLLIFLSTLIVFVVIRSFTLLPLDTTATAAATSTLERTTNRLSKELRNASFVFVHVGKTGGETIKWRLKVSCKLRLSQRKKDRCYEQFKIGESRISNATIGYLHCDKLRPKGSHQQATAYLFSLRDPIDRIVSWFQYMHPQNCLPGFPSGACNLKKDNNTWGLTFYQQCFPNVNDFFQSIPQQQQPTLASTATTTKLNDCSQMALDTVRGKGPEGPSNHMYFNYLYYANRTTFLHPEKDIVVVRQEYLWKDLKHLEELLGGDPSRLFETEGPVVTHGSEKFVYRAQLTKDNIDAQIPAMCCAIADEISMYAKLLASAKNLNGREKMISIQSLLSKCRVQSLYDLSSTCGSARTT